MTSMKTRTRFLATATSIAALASLVAPSIARAETVYTYADVQKHATQQDCWSIVNGGVYNLTSFIPRHEGGPKVIIAMCGIDGTSSYNGQHGRSSGGENEPAQALAHYRIGAIDPKSVPTATTAYTMSDVAAHAKAADCWSVIDGKVYNLTSWIPKHLGGPAVITAMCGIDGTGMYNSKHKGSSSAAGALANYVIGTLSGPSSTAPTVTQAPNTTQLYTMKQVRAHNKAADCWSVLRKRVYNLTAWVPLHPGGKSTIVALCGKRGAAAFNAQHGWKGSVASILAGYQIGRIA
jgi:cytochrome b involved in lipid metabolism